MHIKKIDSWSISISSRPVPRHSIMIRSEGQGKDAGKIVSAANFPKLEALRRTWKAGGEDPAFFTTCAATKDLSAVDMIEALAYFCALASSDDGKFSPEASEFAGFLHKRIPHAHNKGGGKGPRGVAEFCRSPVYLKLYEERGPGFKIIDLPAACLPGSAENQLLRSTMAFIGDRVAEEWGRRHERTAAFPSIALYHFLTDFCGDEADVPVRVRGGAPNPQSKKSRAPGADLFGLREMLSAECQRSLDSRSECGGGGGRGGKHAESKAAQKNGVAFEPGIVDPGHEQVSHPDRNAEGIHARLVKFQPNMREPSEVEFKFTSLGGEEMTLTLKDIMAVVSEYRGYPGCYVKENYRWAKPQVDMFEFSSIGLIKVALARAVYADREKDVTLILVGQDLSFGFFRAPFCSVRGLQHKKMCGKRKSEGHEGLYSVSGCSNLGLSSIFSFYGLSFVGKEAARCFLRRKPGVGTWSETCICIQINVLPEVPYDGCDVGEEIALDDPKSYGVTPRRHVSLAHGLRFSMHAMEKVSFQSAAAQYVFRYFIRDDAGAFPRVVSPEECREIVDRIFSLASESYQANSSYISCSIALEGRTHDGRPAFLVLHASCSSGRRPDEHVEGAEEISCIFDLQMIGLEYAFGEGGPLRELLGDVGYSEYWVSFVVFDDWEFRRLSEQFGFDMSLIGSKYSKTIKPSIANFVESIGSEKTGRKANTLEWSWASCLSCLESRLNLVEYDIEPWPMICMNIRESDSKSVSDILEKWAVVVENNGVAAWGDWTRLLRAYLKISVLVLRRMVDLLEKERVIGSILEIERRNLQKMGLSDVNERLEVL